MPVRLIEVVAAPRHSEKIASLAKKFEAPGFWSGNALDSDRVASLILARSEGQQELIDEIQGVLGDGNSWHVVILPVEAALPEVEVTKNELQSAEQATREELYTEMDQGSKIDLTFAQLVVLSTIVATIGLLEESTAIIIGAMLIAPMYGPSVAMALGSVLGDRELLTRAAVANAVGVALSVITAAVAALFFPWGAENDEFLMRTSLGYDSLVLALASGAAGALSLTTRLSGTIVGVMIAVALLPPAVTLGYMLGLGAWQNAAGAASLLVANIVCINLSAQIVFLTNGVKPRRWIERRAAKQSTQISLAIAILLLLVLVLVAYLQRG